MKHFTTFLFSLFSLGLFAQYTTPGEGATYTLGDLVEMSEGVVTEENGDYFIHAELTIALNDTLTINDIDVYIDEDVRIVAAGGFLVSNAKLTSPDEDQIYHGGLRFEETAHVIIDEATISYGGSVRVITPDFKISNSLLTKQINGAASSAVLAFSNGKPEIINCEFIDNDYAAISSPGNGAVAPVIEGNYFHANGTKNSNRPQINLGPTGPDTTFIRNNTVIGVDSLDRVGGISVGLLLGGTGRAVVENNEIVNNRYGINYMGADLITLTRDNQILGNDNESNFMMGGSGISITGAGETNLHVILGNTISDNLWGITLINSVYANLGEIDNPEIGPGNNFFDGNGNGGVIYALYNNGPNDQWAQGNCWIASNPEATLEDAAEVIFDAADGEYGEVFFDPMGQCVPDAVGEVDFNHIAKLYPNPTFGDTRLELGAPAVSYTIYDLTGREVETRDLTSAGNTVTIRTGKFTPGLYIVRVDGENFRAATKLIVR